MNNKASITGFLEPMYIISGFLIIGLFVLIVFITFQNILTRSQIPEGLEEFILTERFLSSCFIPEEQTYLSNTIDWDKFNSNYLNDCFLTDDKNSMQFRLTLIDQTKGDQADTISTKHWSNKFNQESPYTVTILRNNEENDGILIIAS